MGIVSLMNANRLFWLGRYSERVYTTIRLFEKNFDEMIESESVYETYCRNMDIPNIYSDADDFTDRYLFSPEDPNSIISNLYRAYDNAIVLREEIGSEALSYLQLAVYDLKKTKGSSAPLIGLQKVLDHILAFWGMADDSIADGNIRNIIKSGKRVERLDLYARLYYPMEDLKLQGLRLRMRLSCTNLKYEEAQLEHLLELVSSEALDHFAIINCVESLVEV